MEAKMTNQEDAHRRALMIAGAAGLGAIDPNAVTGIATDGPVAGKAGAVSAKRADGATPTGLDAGISEQ